MKKNESKQEKLIVIKTDQTLVLEEKGESEKK